MTAIYRILLMAVLATLGTQASAQSRHWGRYEMVTVPQNQNNSTDKVVILDKRTGELWAWSESSAIMFLGKIFPIAEAGPFARIIHVNPEENDQ